jgi:hypothetical protein
VDQKQIFVENYFEIQFSHLVLSPRTHIPCRFQLRWKCQIQALQDQDKEALIVTPDESLWQKCDDTVAGHFQVCVCSDTNFLATNDTHTKKKSKNTDFH